MTKNPILNALSAALYIALVACLMFYGKGFAPPKDTIFAPIAMLSLLTLSAAVMGVIFFYQPIVLISEGHHAPALNLLLRTVASFALLTALFFVLLFSPAFR